MKPSRAPPLISDTIIFQTFQILSFSLIISGFRGDRACRDNELNYFELLRDKMMESNRTRRDFKLENKVFIKKHGGGQGESFSAFDLRNGVFWNCGRSNGNEGESLDRIPFGFKPYFSSLFY
ncbi:hypothetical protein AVEN_27448-1 [Araneus ventricosus]|uniref:Uncharacterized protein n=1 Tax=Araneus ventricosus TaxID=182803 RepID=A0A4Y2EGV5_ARAVE|nr:hypothetical protein AVEN_27448-1 [Araneus ventricosus]